MDADAGFVEGRPPCGSGSKIRLTQKAQGAQEERKRWASNSHGLAQRRRGAEGEAGGPASTRAGSGTRTPWKASLQKRKSNKGGRGGTRPSRRRECGRDDWRAGRRAGRGRKSV